MKSESKYTPVMMLLRQEFGTATRAAKALGVSYPTLWRYIRTKPERLMALILHSTNDTFTVQLVTELNRLVQMNGREQGGQC